MQAIVLVEHLKDAHAILARKTKEVHIRIIHAEEDWKSLRLLVFQEMGMIGLAVAIGASKKVKVWLRVSWRAKRAKDTIKS